MYLFNTYVMEHLEQKKWQEDDLHALYSSSLNVRIIK